MYMLGTPRQQEQQQQEQPPQASELGLFMRVAERYAVLEYVLTEQQQQQQLQSSLSINSTGSSVSNSSQGLSSSSDGGAHSSYMPPMMTVLRTSKRLLEPLLQEHCPGFWQWYTQRQQAVKKQGQQPE
jgi:hypothetical protein